MIQNTTNEETRRYPLTSCDTNASLPNHTPIPGEDESFYGNGRAKNIQPEKKEVPLLTEEYGPEQSYQKYERFVHLCVS